MNIQKSALAIALTGLLFGCGGSDSSEPATQMATFSLGVSDNPADAKVGHDCIQASGIKERHR